MKKDILLAIAAHTRGLKPQLFDMETWQNKCGTVGCAIGHAAKAELIPGLKLVRQLYPRPEGELDFVWKPQFGSGTDGFEGVAQALDISYDEAEWLFDPDAYDPAGEDEESFRYFVTPQQVAERIEQFVNSDGEAKP